MTKRSWIVLTLAVIVVGVLLGSVASGQELETLRLSEVVRSVFYSPQYVAIELGFFRDEGFEIDLSTAWGADICRDRVFNS